MKKKLTILLVFINIFFSYSQSSFYSPEHLLLPENISLEINLNRDAFMLKNLIIINKDSLRVLRNTLYAINGREFKSEDLKKYFNAKEWYKPNVNYSDRDLNSGTQKLINMILYLEERVNKDGPLSKFSKLNSFSDRTSIWYDMDKDGIYECFYFFIKKKNTVSEVLDYQNITLVIMSDYGFVELKLPISDSYAERVEGIQSNSIKYLTNTITSIWDPEYASHYYGLSLVNNTNVDYNFIELFILFGCDEGYECIEGKYIYLYNKELKIIDRGIISQSDAGWDINLEYFKDYNR